MTVGLGAESVNLGTVGWDRGRLTGLGEGSWFGDGWIGDSWIGDGWIGNGWLRSGTH